MLAELDIKNFAIIDDLKLALRPGLAVFTGETGAGKSIIVDALEMLLGGRADATVVRSGTDMALIEGVFRLDERIRQPVEEILAREALDGDADHLVLGREVRLEGRNVCRVNGRVVNLSVLRELGEYLVDVHGQSEHLSLLQVRHHLALLDRYAACEDLLDAYVGLYQALRQVRTELEELRRGERDAVQRADTLTFQVNEIEAAALQADEEQSLLEERTRLANAEKLASLSEQAIAALDEGLQGEISVSDLMGQAVEAIDDLAGVDSSLTATREEAQALLEQISDLTRRLRVYRESVEFNPKRLDEVEERVGLIRDLSRKYGEGVEAILAHAERARRELETITHAGERLAELEQQEGRLLVELAEAGGRLTQARQRAADQLGRAIETELDALGMSGAKFTVDMQWDASDDGAPVDGQRLAFGPRGFDRVEFLVAPNPGEGLKPLVKIASGGETSRLMLGLKGVLARADHTPSLIFDEIDQGIGGRIGAVVGQKLWGLAQTHQVLCITHLPQLAAYADEHFKVEKQVRDGRTLTVVRTLEEADRTGELAEMLGGGSEPNQLSAMELLSRAVEAKQEPPA